MTRAVAGWRGGLVGLLCFAAAACDETEAVVTGTDQYEANDILFCLKRHGVDAARIADEDGGISIVVPKEQYLKAFQVMKVNNLPRRDQDSLMSVFPDEGMFKSPTFERVRMRFGLETEMANSLELINGVREARVHIVVPRERDRRNQKTSDPSASVIIIHDETLDPGQATEGIQTFVANANEGMPTERVSVSFFLQSMNDLIDCKGAP